MKAGGVSQAQYLWNSLAYLLASRDLRAVGEWGLRWGPITGNNIKPTAHSTEMRRGMSRRSLEQDDEQKKALNIKSHGRKESHTEEEDEKQEQGENIRFH